MADDQEDKTEQPTGKRLAKAREEGQVPLSQEVKSWAMLLAATVVLGTMASHLATGIKQVALPFIEAPHAISADFDSLRRLAGDVALQVAWYMLLPIGLLMVVAVLSTVGQIGWVVSTKKLKPKFEQLNPINGLKRYVSLKPYIEFVKGIFKQLLVGAVLIIALWPHRNELQALVTMELPGILDYLGDMILFIALTTVLVLTVIAVADLAYTRWDHTEKLKMTRQEVKDENKQTEGDPMIKGRIRSLRIKKARQRMMQAVPKADVVITNPTHYAVAMKYDMDTMQAPVVVAKGTDYLARKIREMAEEHDVAIVQNPPLARALYAAVEIDQEIPAEHYKAVAEVIGYVMRLKGKLGA